MTACGWRSRAGFWRSRTLAALHCTSVLTAYLPTGVIDLKIRRKSLYLSVCELYRSSQVKAVCLRVLLSHCLHICVYVCVHSCIRFLSCSALHLRFLTCLLHSSGLPKMSRKHSGDLWALRNPLLVGGCAKDIQCVQ